MANVSLWSNVAVAVQSAIGSAVPINAVTKANPGVVTYTGTDPSNGDYVYVSAQGMTQINGRVFRVANVNTGSNTFEMESEDTTSYGTFSSGNFYVLTMGTSLLTATSISGSGGDFDFIDTTTIHDEIKSQVPGAANPAVYTMENIWDNADAGQAALRAASKLKGLRAIRFSFSNGQKFAFMGYIGATGLPVGQAQDKVTTTIVATMFGAPSYWAT